MSADGGADDLNRSTSEAALGGGDSQKGDDEGNDGGLGGLKNEASGALQLRSGGALANRK